MTSGEPTVSVAVLREAAARLVERTSLRTAAGEIGISHSGLRTFLLGTDPYGPTLVKLRAWFAQTDGGKAMSPERARALVAMLLEGVPAKNRKAAERRVLDAVAEAHREAGTDPPDWLQK
jgi:hypothetical protein